MKKPNKYQLAEWRRRRKLIADGALQIMADEAIAAACQIMKLPPQAIDASDMLASGNAMTRYLGGQMDGHMISPEISAKVELETAAAAIYKLSKIGDNELAPEMRPQLDRIDAVKAALGLIESKEEVLA